MQSGLRILLAAALFWILGTIGLVLFSALRSYRTDLTRDQNAYEGSSWLPIVNYLSAGNYSHDGLRLLRVFWAWHLAMFIALVAIAWLVRPALSG